MQKVFGNIFSIFIEVACLVLSVIWYLDEKEIEPVIVMVVSIGAIITSIFFKKKVENTRVEEEGGKPTKISKIVITDQKISSKEKDIGEKNNKEINPTISKPSNLSNSMISNETLASLLQEAFDSGSLDDFCFKYFPETHGNFSAGFTKTQKVIQLINDCRQREKIGYLLEKIKLERPEKYQKFVRE